MDKKINSLSNNPILCIFTKAYRDEVRYYSFMEDNMDRIKLRCDNGNIEEKISKLGLLGNELDFRVRPLYDLHNPDEKVRRKSLHIQDIYGSIDSRKENI